MSTQPYTTQTDAEIQTARTAFMIENAPQTFDPTNTDPCPEMFADKWQAADR
jgi:hypothetical protein